MGANSLIQHKQVVTKQGFYYSFYWLWLLVSYFPSVLILYGWRAPLCLLKATAIINCWVPWTSKQENKLSSCTCLLDPLLAENQPLFYKYCLKYNVQLLWWNFPCYYHCQLAKTFHIQLLLKQAMKPFSTILVSDKAVLEKGAKDWKHCGNPCTACSQWFLLNKILLSQAIFDYTWDFGL